MTEWQSRRSVTGEKTYYWRNHGPFMFSQFPNYRVYGRENRQLMPMNIWPFGTAHWDQVLYRLDIRKKGKASAFCYISYGSYSMTTGVLMEGIPEDERVDGARFWHLDAYVRRNHSTLDGPEYCVSTKTWDEFFEEAKEVLKHYLGTGGFIAVGMSVHDEN